jgi:nitric oxide reductase activation protein
MNPTDKRNNAADQQDQQASQQQPRQDIDRENENVAAAYQEASKDIEQDPDLSIQSPNDDLDEGEAARLGENTGLI